MLVHDGFLYRFESKNDKKTIWKCVENLKKKCKARIHTDENSILSDVTKISHVHFPDIAKIEAKRAMENLKELAKKTELSTQSVVATVASEVIYTICLNNNLIFLIYYYIIQPNIIFNIFS